MGDALNGYSLIVYRVEKLEEFREHADTTLDSIVKAVTSMQTSQRWAVGILLFFQPLLIGIVFKWIEG